ncbi:MAG: DASS family sodium-coupled anion symporter [Saprospiraceae bacterium]|nr:DASS family sodium-coupled anion symporter [Saprospiraceae bacterium]
MKHWKIISWIAGPLAFLILYNCPTFLPTGFSQKVVAVAVWMIIWWLTEVVSISVTALLPLFLFPFLNILPLKEVSANYGSPIVFLFFGGFVMALGLEKVNLHRRIALNIISWTGTSPNKVILGFMLSTALLSMWISNTASTVVMLPIALSVINLIAKDDDGFTGKDQNFALSIMLAIAFSANIGGVSTLIGTPPNSVFAGFIENEYNIQIGFFEWMKMGVPFSILMLLICYFVIVKWMYPSNLKSLNNPEKVIQSELQKLGKMSGEEKLVVFIFAIAISLWVLKNSLNAIQDYIEFSDPGISVLAAFLLFSIPKNLNMERVLDWKDTIKLPWGILILFGGGLALANGLSSAGVMDMIGNAISESNFKYPFLISIGLIAIMLFMTELMSNVALVAVFIPVVAGIALGLDIPLMYLCIPVTMAASCAFMLPMATPPNAIVFASGYVKVYQMARVGFILNVLSVIFISLFAKFIIPLIF